MKTERNQLTSVGQRRIWSLSDAPPEKEVFQSARILRDGIAEPLLSEETPSFPFHKNRDIRFEENRGSDVTFVRIRQGCKSLSNKLQFAA